MKKLKNSSSKWKKRCVLTQRDIRILRYLWKWKTLSTRALAVKFFPDVSAHGAYRRLIRLEDAGFIEAIDTTKYWQIVWALTARGFKRIRPLLGELSGEGFRSENYLHDHIATAFHLGEWLTHQPAYTQTFTEQQLRRISPELWDEWVPKFDSHRPDGYSLYFQGEKEVILAFEAELTLKQKRRYESVVAFYDTHTSIQLVFWLVDSKVTLNSMKHTFEKFHVREWSKHHFILLSDFREKGWYAPFVTGQFQGKTPADFLLPSDIPRVSPGYLCGDTLALLDTAKKPVISELSKKPQNS